MFTGIVEETGTVAEVDGTADAQRIRISCSQVLQDATHGASISVNGVCLTVTEFDSTGFWADCMKVTLDYTALGSARQVTGSTWSEPPRPADASAATSSRAMWTAPPPWSPAPRAASGRSSASSFPAGDAGTSLARYVAKKGSIAVNGVSLTVAEVGPVTDPWFEVSLIPTTLADTMLGDLATGDTVNIECDVLAKYLERLAQAEGSEGSKETPSERPEPGERRHRQQRPREPARPRGGRDHRHCRG